MVQVENRGRHGTCVAQALLGLLLALWPWLTSTAQVAYYSSSNFPTHHIFFPLRLQVVAFQQDPDGFSAYPWYQLAFDHLFGQQAHRPARPS